MTQINQNSTNLRPKPKAPLILFIVSILILISVGGYFAYTRSFWTNDQITNSNIASQTNSITNNTNTDNSTTTNNLIDTNTDNSINTQIPSGWIEHELTSCGIKIYLPPDRSFNVGTSANGNYSMISNSSKKLNDINASHEGPPSLRINCYKNLENFVNSSSSAQSLSKMPASLEEALNTKNPHSEIFYNIFDFASKPQEITLNGRKGFQGLQGGFGVTLNRFFEHNGKIVEIITENFDQNTLKLDDIDQQIQDLIKFST